MANGLLVEIHGSVIWVLVEEKFIDYVEIRTGGVIGADGKYIRQNSTRSSASKSIFSQSMSVIDAILSWQSLAVNTGMRKL